LTPSEFATGRDFRLAHERCAFLDNHASGLQISHELGPGFQFAAFHHCDVAVNLAQHRDGFCFDLAANVGVFTNRETAVGNNFALDLAVDNQLVGKFYRPFDFDVFGKDVFGKAIGHGR